MTLMSRWLGAVLLVRRRPSRYGNRVILSSSLSVRLSRDSISVSRCYRLRPTRSRRWGGPTRSRPQVFRRNGGARLFTHDGQNGRYVDFTCVREVTRPQTYQVCREEFDRILLKRAREVGVDVREACNVIKCEFAADAEILDIASRVDDATQRVRVRALVDATGRGGLIARKFNLRAEEPRLANVAIYSHYTNVPRLEGLRPDDIRLIA